MNKRARQRLIGVTIIILVVVGVLFAFASNSAGVATPATIEQVLNDKELVDKKIKVSGQVVAGSWVAGAKPFTFEIEDGESDGRVKVVWEDVVPGSFGDGTSAIVTGTLGADGTIQADSLVTKCPSKYESATGALTVGDLIARSAELKGTTVKVTGFVVEGSIADSAEAPVRFRIADTAGGSNALDIAFDGGLSDEFEDGAKVVLTGRLTDSRTFECDEVALDESSR